MITFPLEEQSPLVQQHTLCTDTNLQITPPPTPMVEVELAPGAGIPNNLGQIEQVRRSSRNQERIDYSNAFRIYAKRNNALAQIFEIHEASI